MMYFAVDNPLSRVSVFVGHTKETPFLCSFYPGPSVFDEPIKLRCDAPKPGRYVKISTNFDSQSAFVLCEVEVYARVIDGMSYLTVLPLIFKQTCQSKQCRQININSIESLIRTLSKIPKELLDPPAGTEMDIQTIYIRSSIPLLPFSGR